MKVFAGILLVAGILIAQSSQFEVVSVKPATKEARGMRVSGGPGTSDPTRLTCENCSLSMLVMMAYGVRPYQFRAPAWMDTSRYEVLAQMPRNVTNAQFQLMQQRLLADRFGLRVHRQRQQMSIYVLTVGNTGPKFAQTKEPIRDKPSATWMPPPGGPPVRTKARVIRRGDTMADLARFLSDALAAPVKDETGLQGRYDYAMTYIMEPGGRAAGPDALPDVEPDSGPSVVDAVQRELGLALKKSKGEVDVLMVDSAARVPIGN